MNRAVTKLSGAAFASLGSLLLSSCCCGYVDDTAMACGNGVTDVDLGETCDDAIGADGDGCSTACQIEAGFACAPTPALSWAFAAATEIGTGQSQWRYVGPAPTGDALAQPAMAIAVASDETRCPHLVGDGWIGIGDHGCGTPGAGDYKFAAAFDVPEGNTESLWLGLGIDNYLVDVRLNGESIRDLVPPSMLLTARGYLSPAVALNVPADRMTSGASNLLEIVVRELGKASDGSAGATFNSTNLWVGAIAPSSCQPSVP